MNNTYICHTIYHLMIALIKINKHQHNSLMLCGIDEKVLIDRLVKNNLFNNIYIYENTETTVDQIKILKKSDNIFIFNDWTVIGMELYNNKLEYHLIEDGYNYHQKKYDKLRKKMLGKVSFLRFVYNKIINYPYFFGNNKYCLSIEVNSLKDLPKDKRRCKFKEVSRRELLKNMNQEKQEELRKIFKIPELSMSKKSVLILTQPLYQDKLVETYEEQYKFYEQICEEYSQKGYDIYFKSHPRDKVDYTSLYYVKFIEKNIPIELLEYFKKTSFDIGITHSSTSLDFLECVDNKVILCRKSEEIKL